MRKLTSSSPQTRARKPRPPPKWPSGNFPKAGKSPSSGSRSPRMPKTTRRRHSFGSPRSRGLALPLLEKSAPRCAGWSRAIRSRQRIPSECWNGHSPCLKLTGVPTTTLRRLPTPTASSLVASETRATRLPRIFCPKRESSSPVSSSSWMRQRKGYRPSPDRLMHRRQRRLKSSSKRKGSGWGAFVNGSRNRLRWEMSLR